MRLLLLLLFIGQSATAQKKWTSISRNDIVIYSLMIVSGAADGVNQAIIHHELGKTDETICTCFAIFGSLIALTSLIQFLAYTTFNWLSLVIIGVYLFNIIAYVLLGLLRRYAPLFIFINTLLSLLIYIIFTYAYIFSPIIIILFVCNSVAAIIIVHEKLPAKIKHRRNAERLEDEYWKGKL